MTEKSRAYGDSSESSVTTSLVNSTLAPSGPSKPSLPPPRVLDTVWTGLDRKASAIIEFTSRQLRVRSSTWVIGAVGVLVMTLLLATYAQEMASGIEPIDDDGDSEDWDGDGYPQGQENQYGTSDWDAKEFPGSGRFVEADWLGWDDRNVTGNYTYNGNGVIEEYTWIANNSDDDRYIAINEQRSCAWEEEYTYGLGYGDSCMTDDNEIRFYGMVTLNGTVAKSDQGWLSWGEMVGQSDTVVEPHNPSIYIDEDGIDLDIESGNVSQGYDDDGDCRNYQDESTSYRDDEYYWYSDMQDTNGNGIDCDVELIFDADGNLIRIEADWGVDEDPSESEFTLESAHRGFILAVSKVAFLFILGIFIPMFLATGLVRDEMASGTMYYLIGKPIHRAEFFLYRILGFMLLAGPYMLGLAVTVGIVTGFLGPSESLFRFQDLTVWLIVGIASALVLLAYSTTFAMFGVLSKRFGAYIAIVMGLWEFIMAFFSLLSGGQSRIAWLSVSHWGIEMVNAAALIAWPDSQYYDIIGEGYYDSADIFSVFWNAPTINESPAVALLVAAGVLVVYVLLMVGLGQSFLGRREID
tara:strand:- start:120 stop:1859 length:1740 start_codon:yes stop_codon:yes gene_type:complete